MILKGRRRQTRSSAPLHNTTISYNKNQPVSQINFWNETLHVSDSSSVHHQEFFHCTHSNSICHTGLLTACEQVQAD